jgi:putative MATE family efflux protein
VRDLGSKSHQLLPVERDRSVNSYRKIIDFALPVGLESIAQTSFSLIDQVIIGLLGTEAVAGVGLSNTISFTILLIYSAIGTGSGVLVAQASGQKNMEEVSTITALGQMFAGIFGVCTGLPLMLFPAVILHWAGAQAEVANGAAGYLQLFAAAAPFTVMSAVTTATFRSLNDTRTPMIITIAAVAFSTVTAFLLVLGIAPFPKLGVLGAGIATLLAQALRCLILMIALYWRKEGPRWRWPWHCFGNNRIARSLIEISYPLVLSELLWGISAFAYTVIFGRLGTNALAASQIVMVIESVFIVAAAGLPPAAVAFIGQAIGADSIPSAKKNAGRVLRVGVLAGVLFTIVLVGASFLLPILYPKVAREVLQLAFWGLLIAASVQCAKVLNGVLGTGILPSGGDTKFVLAGHLVGSYLIGLPSAFLLGIFFRSSLGVFGARAIEEIVKVIAYFFRFRNSFWRRKSLAISD